MIKLFQINKVFTPFKKKEVMFIDHLEPSDWRKPIIEFLRNPSGQFDRKQGIGLVYMILGYTLFKNSSDGGLLTCLSEDKAYLALVEVPKGISGAHQAGDRMKWTLYQQRVYWPTMIKDCMDYTKAYDSCQRHANTQHVPASDLHLIVKPWPFRGWAMDIIGQVNSPSLKGHKFILVAFDYFSMWAEAEDLKEIPKVRLSTSSKNKFCTDFEFPKLQLQIRGQCLLG